MSRQKKYDRDEVLERAMHAFWIKGYSATSINDLVNATGLNRFSLYKEFENKDELYLESFKKYERSVMEQRMIKLEQSGEGIECLRNFFLDYVHEVKEGLEAGDQAVSCLTVLNATEKIGREPASSKTMKRILKRMSSAFEAVLQRAMKCGEISKKSNIQEYALFLIGCTYGLDIMSKFLTNRELETYINQVLTSLK